MRQPDRRTVLTGAAASPLLAPPVAAAATRAQPALTARIQADLERYDAFGDKAAGGGGDNASGEWLEEELRRIGFTLSRQTYRIPFFEPAQAELTAGGARAQVIPQHIVIPTPAGGVEGTLCPWGERAVRPGEIAFIVLPFQRWSAARNPGVRTPVNEALQAGAAAVVLVTTGPTGEAIALNAPAERPLFDRPVVVLAPRDAAPFLAAARAGGRARLVVTGRGGERQAFNVIGEKAATLRAPVTEGLVVSTPRSGWFKCTGERGPGIAVWLSLARWLAAAPRPYDLTFLATSGHEYDNQGGVLYLADRAPDPARTRLWTHLGANVATRDWHETAEGLWPLPSTDAQRFLVGTPAVVPTLQRAFAGLPGLEQPYPSTRGSDGELRHILEKGYARAFGVFGAHRRHHLKSDDLRSTSGEIVAPTALAFRAAVWSLAGLR